MEQIAIALTGVVAIWLSQDHRIQFRKWASIFGLIGQPFWFYLRERKALSFRAEM